MYRINKSYCYWEFIFEIKWVFFFFKNKVFNIFFNYLLNKWGKMNFINGVVVIEIYWLFIVIFLVVVCDSDIEMYLYNILVFLFIKWMLVKLM